MSQTALHTWEPTGLTSYPITHPIVGQTDFYRKLKNWLPLIESDRFIHLFAVVASWGVGKSRLGYEIVAQINGTSQGWKVRDEKENLVDAKLFDDESVREKYLALYIRYSQVANPRLNLDNWFAPAVYKALAPLARGTFDMSIQHQIAKQALVRLEAIGFDPTKLALAMELDQHSEEKIYTDTVLATRLCTAAFEALKPFGIGHVVLVLDELETATERATSGIETEEARVMDGKAITMLQKAAELLGREDIEMLGKAVKEEDARARFPWLRFVTLCSPAIGDALGSVQSTDRRFEIVSLARNAFADVSTFVASLKDEGRLLRPYPKGLVEAAYMMSGANFGWFNVIMAVVDQVLRNVPADETPSMAWVFRRAIQIQERIGRYLLDERALDEISLDLSSETRDTVAELLFGQLPQPLDRFGDEKAREILGAKNMYGEPLAIRYHRATWRLDECTQVLISNKFSRESGTAKWKAPGIPEPIDLERLLDDVATLAVAEGLQKSTKGQHRLLLPRTLPDFLQLLDLIHPHQAAEEAGRALWMGLLGSSELPEGEATHIGPSIEMLRRLDIRLRKASVGTVLRNPDENRAFSETQERAKPNDRERPLQVLTGSMRLLDQNWAYDLEPAGLGDEVAAIRTSKKDGLVDFKGLWLHPKGQAVLAWVRSDAAFKSLAVAVAADHVKQGRYPVIAFTTDYGMPERIAKETQGVFTKARESIVLIHLNSGEESALLSVGLPVAAQVGFELRRDGFTTQFSERLNRIRSAIGKRIAEWRREASRQGIVAWPIRPIGTLKPEVLERLVESWRKVMLDQDGKRLGDLGVVEGLDLAELIGELNKLGQSPSAPPKGYSADELAGLWVGEGEDAYPEAPSFLVRSIGLRLRNAKNGPLTLESAKSEWFWGYTWDGNRAGEIFRDWMIIAVDLGWAEEKGEGKQKGYSFVPLESFRGELDAARNWLSKEYPIIIGSLEAIFGPGEIEKFKPQGGTKYKRAKKALKQAEELLEELKTLDANPPSDDSDPAEARDWFIRVTRLRLEVRKLVQRVFSKKEYEDLPPDLDNKQINLLDEGMPLWERIKRAEQFADAVKTLAQRIQDQIPWVGDQMRDRVLEIPSFPLNLFTRPLAKIGRIVDDGMTGKNPSYSTTRVEAYPGETLAFYLKEIRVADAIASLRSLAREVGADGASVGSIVFDEIKGDIVKGFRDLVARYGKAQTELTSLTKRVQELSKVLEDSPKDFTLPVGASLGSVAEILPRIAESLRQSLEEDVEELLEQHDREMNFGRFGPLMEKAKNRLLDQPELLIRGLEGKVRTLENCVVTYRRSLLEDTGLQSAREGLNALRRCKGKAEVTHPVMADLEKRTLKDGRTFTFGTKAQWLEDGNGLLTGTGVSFVEWLSAIEAVRAQEEPKLSGTQVDGLVTAGFLRRVYALGGG